MKREEPAQAKDGAPPTTSFVPQAGRPQIAGHQVIRELARGGLGVVFLARHVMLNDLRAIKRPLDQPDLNRDSMLARFRREVRAVGSLRHDHVIRAHDAGVDDHGPYLVMEYLDGLPLGGLVQQHGRLPVSAACELIRQAALGLQAAHEGGLVHRDIKPSNLMLARANTSARVVVIDWGLVKGVQVADERTNEWSRDVTAVGTSLGTPGYMSPEQARGATDLTIRSDIYSLGVTLCCLLTGRPALAAPSGMASGQEMSPAERNLVLLREIRQDVPEGLKSCLAKMVENDPNRRFATPRDVAFALFPFCKGASSSSLRTLLESCHSPVTASPWPGGLSSAAASTASMLVSDTGKKQATRMADEQQPAASRDTVGSSHRKRAGWLVLAVGLFVAAVAATSLFFMATGKSGSGGLMDVDWEYDETFETTPAGALPAGWKGAAYSVQPDGGKTPSLEIMEPTGTPVLTLPPPPPTADFDLDLSYLLHGHGGAGYSGQRQDQVLGARLVGKAGEEIRVVVKCDGEVGIGDRLPRIVKSARSGQRANLRLSRRKEVVSVTLQGQIAAAGHLPAGFSLQRLELDLTAGRVERLRSDFARIYSVRLMAPKKSALDPVAAKESSATTWIDEKFSTTGPGEIPSGWKGGEFAVLQDAVKKPCLEVTATQGQHEIELPALPLSGRWYFDVECCLSGHGGAGFSGTRQNQQLQLLVDAKDATTITAAVDFDGGVSFDDRPPRQVATLRSGEPLRVRLEFTGDSLRVLINGREAARENRETWPAFQRLRLGLTAGTVSRVASDPARIYRVVAGPL